MTSYNKDFLIKASDFIDFYNSKTRKSISYNWIVENGFEIEYSYQRPCDYLKVVKEVFNL